MKTVLIVDDSGFMRRMMKKVVIDNGYIVAGEADSGTAAIERYKELKPAIVTMDITMGDMSGLDALNSILIFDPDAKVIIVSSMSQEIIVRDAIMRGAKGFIVKPFEANQILNAFSKLFKQDEKR